MSGGMRFASSDEVGLLPPILNWPAAKEDKEGDIVGRYWKIMMPISRRLCRKRHVRSLPGVLLRTRLQDTWLGRCENGVAFMVEGRDVYRPRLLMRAGTRCISRRRNLGAGGHLWAENRQQWAFKPAVVQASFGDGLVIGFVADPFSRSS